MVDIIAEQPSINPIPFNESNIHSKTYNELIKKGTDPNDHYVQNQKEKDALHCPKQVLSSQHLNIKFCNDPNLIIDSIGFIDNKLHVITSLKSNSYDRLRITDENGNDCPLLYVSEYENGLEYEVYDVKNLEALCKCKLAYLVWKDLPEEKGPDIDKSVTISLVAK